MLDGTPLSAPSDPTADVLALAAQKQIAELCRFLEVAAPAHVRKATIECPLRDLQREAESKGQHWPVSRDATFGALKQLASRHSQTNRLIGWDALIEPSSVEWLAVRLRTNTLKVTGADRIRPDAAWFESLLAAHESSDAYGSGVRGWVTSDSFVWMEATEEAVDGTVATLANAATFATACLILLTGSFSVACSTVLGVLIVLTCFLGYAACRAYKFGPVEAVALTVFIGFACDYCVHTVQLYHLWRPLLQQRGGEAVFTRTLSHAGPSLYGAALTTVGACLPLLWCQIVVFVEFGELIIVCALISLAVALTLLAPAVAAVSALRGET